MNFSYSLNSLKPLVNKSYSGMFLPSNSTSKSLKNNFPKPRSPSFSNENLKNRSVAQLKNSSIGFLTNISFSQDKLLSDLVNRSSSKESNHSFQSSFSSDAYNLASPVNSLIEWNFELSNKDQKLKFDFSNRELMSKLIDSKNSDYNIVLRNYDYLFNDWIDSKHPTLPHPISLSQMTQTVDNLDQWQERKNERIEKLEQLDIPLTSLELDFFLDSLETFVKKLNSDVENQKLDSLYPKVFYLTFTDKSGIEKKFPLLVFKNNGYEILLANSQPFSNGTYKKIFKCWSITGEPQELAIAFSNFQKTEHQFTALNEVLQLNDLFAINPDQNNQYTPELFKCFYLKGNAKEDQQQVLVMDYIPTCLFDTMSLNRTTKEKIRLAIEIAKRIEFLHSKNLVHRDLKPENILFNRKKQPILIDFGFTCRADEEQNGITKLEERKGTLDYLAPELLFGLDKKAFGLTLDIWSFGVIIFELIYGEKPWDFQIKSDQWINQNDVYDQMMNFSEETKDDLSPKMELFRSIFDLNPAFRPSISEIICTLTKWL